LTYLKISKSILSKYYQDINNNLKLILKNELLHYKSEENSKITNIVYGVVRKERILDFIISRLSKIKTKKIEIGTILLLKIGLFLIYYSDSIPNYAIINEIVKLSKHRSKKFINAILRNSIRQKDLLSDDIKDSKYPIKYSISQELIDNIKLLTNEVNTFLEYLNKEPIFHLLENKANMKLSNQDILKPLNLISPLNTYELLKPEKLIKSHLKNSSLYIQNTGSQLISIITSVFASKNVLDYCAAPGTKSITIKNSSKNLNIIANDISFKRINLFNKNATPNIQLTTSDILKPAFKDVFDFILIDAPCSSAGTLRKNPDLKTKINQTIIDKNANIQKNILKSILNKFSSKYILYSVCSFIKSETEDIIENAIKETKKPRTIDLTDILDKYNFKYKKSKYGYYLLPDHKLNNDLFYISLISNK